MTETTEITADPPKPGTAGRAAGEIKAFAKQFRNLLAIADELSETGSLDRMADVLSKRITELQAQERAIEAKTEAANAEAARIVAEAEAKADTVIVNAEAIRADAQRVESRAKAVLEAAQVEAASIIDAAKADAARIEQAASDIRAQAQADADRLAKRTSEVAEATRNLANLVGA